VKGNKEMLVENQRLDETILRFMVMNFSLRWLLLSFLAVLLAGCESAAPKGQTAESASNVSIPFLLSMDFKEASAISAQTSQVPPFAKIAADQIEVLKTGPTGLPRKVRATGHVFVQLDYEQPARILCQEALITETQAVLRGKPVLQRGPSTAEGVSDVTVFYLNLTQLRIIGPHKMTLVQDMARQSGPLGAWSGPNPLLPSLDSSAAPLPEDVRKSLEAEMALQQSRVGLPQAFPEAGSSPLLPPVEVPKSEPAPKEKEKTKPETKPKP
jgi:hypothetical protein